MSSTERSAAASAWTLPLPFLAASRAATSRAVSVSLMVCSSPCAAARSKTSSEVRREAASRGAGEGEAGAYVGFRGDEGEARVREAYPGATWDRLTAIKHRYDPTNLFRLNQNIPSANR